MPADAVAFVIGGFDVMAGACARPRAGRLGSLPVASVQSVRKSEQWPEQTSRL